MKKLPVLKLDRHKGDAGRILLIGGSLGMSGSILLATQAALRVGAGLAFVAVPKEIGDIVESKSLESMTIYCDSAEGEFGLKAWKQIEKKTLEADVILVGPGMGQGAGAERIVEGLSKLKGKRIVVDADALNLISQKKYFFQSEIIFTPHIGEMKRLDKKNAYDNSAEFVKLASAFSENEKLCLVLKNLHTIVACQGSFYQEKAGNPGMATGGMGDVLAGTIAGLLLESHVSVFDLVCLAVHLHSYTADCIVKNTAKRSLLPSDIIARYSETLLEFE